MIVRNKYMNRLIKVKENGQVKILTGVRRSGKSTLLKQLMQYFIDSGIPSNSIGYIDFEKAASWKYKNVDTIHQYVANLAQINGSVLFIDEVQEIDEWAKIVNSLNASYKVDIYVTGSNARVFAGEHLTYLAGRYTSINVYPLSFEEFVDYQYKDSQKIYDYSPFYEVFIKSTFPKFVTESDEVEKENVLNDLYQSVFRRDIIERGKIRDENKFWNVSRFIFDNVGSEVSIKKIKDTLTTVGESLSAETVQNYISLILSSYTLFHCPRYDLNGKKLLKTNGKFYSVDPGLQRLIANNSNENRGKIFENFIYLELLKAGYRVNCLNVSRDYEVDFLAIKGSKKMYIQVSLSVIDENTLQREIRPFKLIKDNLPKHLVTWDHFITKSDDYIHNNFFSFIKLIND